MVGEECLDNVVVSVFAEVGAAFSEEGMHPVGVVGSVSVLVVLDDPQSVSKIVGVQRWVKGIS